MNIGYRKQIYCSVSASSNFIQPFEVAGALSAISPERILHISLEWDSGKSHFFVFVFVIVK